MPKLGVNIDHIATLRQQRRIGYPSVLQAAKIVESCGAHQVTVHLREDRRHIQDNDVVEIKNSITIPLNLEMSLNEEIVQFALKVCPDEVCIVPERREELTTEGGLDVKNNYNRLKDVIYRLKDKGIKVSLFIEPEIESVDISKELNVDAVELHTGRYSLCKVGSEEFYKELEKIKVASKHVINVGLILNSGHGLDYNNVRYIAEIEGMNTLNIGFSIVSRAVFVGLETAIKEMLELIKL